LDAATTANVGTIAGGSAPNAVAADVRLEGEVCSHDVARAAESVRAIREVFERVAAEAGGHVEIDMRPLYAGYQLAEDDAVVTTASRAFGALQGGRPSRLLRSGGESDANELNARGISSCVLGIRAEGCHSVHERISVSELELLTDWVLELVSQAAPS
jgi:tripeptide aminopeptidase